MRYLIDTHVLIWWWDVHPSLSDGVRALLESRRAEIFVSAVSGIELGIKVRLGKLPQMVPFISNFGSAIEADGFHHLGIDYEHAVRAGLMPGDPRDPFDRLLAAQALIEEMTVVTRDPALAALGCEVLWNV